MKFICHMLFALFTGMAVYCAVSGNAPLAGVLAGIAALWGLNYAGSKP